MIAKYGHAMTDGSWAGLPLRVGTFAGSGAVEGLQTDNDVVLVWSGGRSEVTIQSHGASSQQTSRHQFIRESGRFDLLPRGTTLKSIIWRGEPTTCTSAALSDEVVAQLLPDRTHGPNPELGPVLNVADAHVVDLVHRLLAQATQPEPLGPGYVRGLSIALVCYVTESYGRSATKPHGPGLPALQSDELIGHVEDHLHEHLDQTTLARVAGYSSDHFARLFKRSFGVSPHQYVTARRIERAKAMLRDPGMPLARIAKDCGFGTQAHFTAVFKQHAAMTPGKYRRG